MTILNQRLIWLDMLKGFLIILVILGHSIQYCLPDETFESNYWWNLIYSFHMPAFMAASGFVNFRLVSPPPLTLCKRRTYQLLLPFLVWSFIKWLVSSNHTISSLIGFTFNSGGFFWFLWTLWIISLLFIFCDCISKKIHLPQEYVVIILGVVLMFSMVLINIRVLGFQYIAYYFLFYSIGFYMNKYHINISNKIIITGLFILWLLTASFWRMHEIPFFLENIHLPHCILLYFYRFFTAILAVFLLFSLFQEIFKNIKDEGKHLIYYGRNSLGLYVLQGVCVIEISNYVVSWLSGTHVILPIIFSFILTLVICRLFLSVLSYKTVSSKILFGKI